MSAGNSMAVAHTRTSVAARERSSTVRSPRWRWRATWAAAIAVMVLLGVYHTTVYFPHRDQPHRFAILDRGFDVGIALAVAWLGLLIGLRCLALIIPALTTTPGARLALATGTGLGAISLGTLALGAVHLYFGATFAILLAGVPLTLEREVGEAGALLRTLLREALAPVHELRRQPSFRGLLRTMPALMCLSIAAQIAFSDMTIPFSNPGYDIYQYHWAVPLLLLRAHGWLAFPGWAHANMAFNTEMLNLVALSLGALQAATLIQDGFLLLSALLIFDLVRPLFGRSTAWFTVIAFLTIPLLLAYSTQSYVGTALIFYGLAALFTLLRWLGILLDDGYSNAGLLLLAGLSLGLALGVKYTALQYVPAAVLTVAGGMALHLRRAWRLGQGAGLSRAARAAVRHIMVFASAVLVSLGPWLVKDAVLLGNPLYPALARVFRTPDWDAARTDALTSTFAHFGSHSGWLAQYHLFAIDLLVNPGPYKESAPFPASMLAMWAALAVPFICYVLARRAKRLPVPFRFETRVIVILALWMFSALGIWTFSGALVERYALPGVALATVLGALLFSWFTIRLARRYRSLAPALVALTVIMYGLCAEYEVSYLFVPAYYRNPLPVISGSVAEKTYFWAHTGAGLTPDFFHAVQYVNGILPHNGKLLMLGRGPGYFVTHRDYVADSGGGWVPYIVSAGKTPSGMLQLLHREGFTYVIYDADVMHFLTHQYANSVIAHYLPAYLAFQQERLVPVAKWGNISLYRVP